MLRQGSLRGGPLVDVAARRRAVLLAGLVDAPLVAHRQVKRDRNRGLVAEQYGALAGHKLVAVGIDLAEFHRANRLTPKIKKVKAKQELL